MIHKHLITLVCLLLAILSYAVGLSVPATALLLLGVLFEAAFWYRLMRKPR